MQEQSIFGANFLYARSVFFIVYAFSGGIKADQCRKPRVGLHFVTRSPKNAGVRCLSSLRSALHYRVRSGKADRFHNNIL